MDHEAGGQLRVEERALGRHGFSCLGHVHDLARGGAAQQDAYREAIEAAGLRIEEIRQNPYEFISDRARDASVKYGVKSVSVRATKN